MFTGKGALLELPGAEKVGQLTKGLPASSRIQVRSPCSRLLCCLDKTRPKQPGEGRVRFIFKPTAISKGSQCRSSRLTPAGECCCCLPSSGWLSYLSSTAQVLLHQLAIKKMPQTCPQAKLVKKFLICDSFFPGISNFGSSLTAEANYAMLQP